MVKLRKINKIRIQYLCDGFEGDINYESPKATIIFDEDENEIVKIVADDNDGEGMAGLSHLIQNVKNKQTFLQEPIGVGNPVVIDCYDLFGLITLDEFKYI